MPPLLKTKQNIKQTFFFILIVRASRKTSTSTTSSPNVSINGNDTDHDDVVNSDQEKPDLGKDFYKI